MADCAWDLCVESPGEESPGDCLECCTLPADADPYLIDKAIVRASEMMRRLSGYNVGLCEETLRPLQQCAECRSTCCGGADGVSLQGFNGEPVEDVLAVRVGSTVIDPDTYRWDVEEQMLWRTPPGRWPRRDKRWTECGEDGSFCVTALVGTPPDAWALDVARSLACELVKSCVGGKCRIPRNATQVTGQGITVTLSEQDVKTLLPEVGGWVSAVNPHGAVVPARVYSPDTEGGRWNRTHRDSGRWDPPWHVPSGR